MNQITAAIRIAFPRARRNQPVGICHSGGTQTVFDCIVCGARHTAATRNRDAKHVLVFRAEHDSQCGARLLAQRAEEA